MGGRKQQKTNKPKSLFNRHYQRQGPPCQSGMIFFFFFFFFSKREELNTKTNEEEERKKKKKKKKAIPTDKKHCKSRITLLLSVAATPEKRNLLIKIFHGEICLTTVFRFPIQAFDAIRIDCRHTCETQISWTEVEQFQWILFASSVLERGFIRQEKHGSRLRTGRQVQVCVSIGYL